MAEIIRNGVDLLGKEWGKVYKYLLKWDGTGSVEERERWVIGASPGAIENYAIFNNMTVADRSEYNGSTDTFGIVLASGVREIYT